MRLVLGLTGQVVYRFGDRGHYWLRLVDLGGPAPGFRRGSWQAVSLSLAPSEPRGCWVTLKPYPLALRSGRVRCTHSYRCSNSQLKMPQQGLGADPALVSLILSHPQPWARANQDKFSACASVSPEISVGLWGTLLGHNALHLVAIK